MLKIQHADAQLTYEWNIGEGISPSLDLGKHIDGVMSITASGEELNLVQGKYPHFCPRNNHQPTAVFYGDIARTILLNIT